MSIFGKDESSIAIASVVSVFASVTIVSVVGLYCGFRYFSEKSRNALVDARADGSTVDKFTNCLQTLLSETRQAGRPIDADKAKDICMNIRGVQASKRSDNNNSKNAGLSGSIRPAGQ